MRSDSANLCRAAYDKGITMFDTANVYQGGNNETMLGNLLAEYPRNSFLVATKVKSASDSDGKPNKETTPEKFMEMFNASMARLKMDYVDILYVHDIRHTDMLVYKPIINTVNNLKKQGKIKFIGFSTHSNEAAVINAAAESNTWDVILTQYNYKLAYLAELNAAVKKAAAAGIGIVAMKTVAGGGFLDRERTKPMNTTAAIKWVLSNPDIHTTIPGMTTFDQLEMNAKIMANITMNEQEKQDLLAAASEPGLFCSGCRECLSSCPKNLPVPDLMRAYMYAYGYGMPSMGKTLLADLGISSDPCRDCNSCAVQCLNRFNLKEKIADISRVSEIPAEFLA
jgi:predicted aldo/keto reductase-like oxidoreductase